MNYSVAIIGAGPGGYVAAIRMAQLGLNVVLIEEKKLGGICLNKGCIPTKALYSATKLLERTQDAKEMGIDFGVPTIDLGTLASWKSGIICRMVTGIKTLLEANNVTLLEARGVLNKFAQVALSTGEMIDAERIVLATGSSPVEIPGFPFADPHIWSSDDALALREIPRRLLVIGGGVIGLELATIFNRLGSKVTILEMMPEILPGIEIDRRAIATLKRSLKTQGIIVRVNSAAKSYEDTTDGLAVHMSTGESVATDRILLAVGRRPNSANIGLETLGIETDRHGFIVVDKALRTNASTVYAIGDLVPGPMLAHKGSAEGLKLAASFVGQTYPLDYQTIPQAIFTDPEVASVGLSEARAKEEGQDVIVGRFPYAALGKAQGMRETQGFFQVVADAKSKRLLGAQIVGAEASALIAEAALAVRNELSLETIADTVHAHPTLPEGLKEAAEVALGRAIHAVNR